MYVRCVFVQYAAVCHYRRFVCVSGAAVRVRSGQTHIQTDGNDIRPHTAQTHSEHTSRESNLVIAKSTAHEPPEDGRTYGPKHVRTTSLKCF